MLVSPVPVEVTRARIQLLAEQTAKAPPRIINDAVLDVFAAKNQAEREAIVDRKA
jgi:predicted transcriptional regulator